MLPALVIQNLWVCTIASLQECAARNELHKLLHQCMCGWLCVSCLRNSESVGVLSSLIGRNVQRRVFSSICVGGCVFAAFVIQNLWVCSVVSLQEMYNGGWFSSICVGGLCVFCLRNSELPTALTLCLSTPSRNSPFLHSFAFALDSETHKTMRGSQSTDQHKGGCKIQPQRSYTIKYNVPH